MSRPDILSSAKSRPEGFAADVKALVCGQPLIFCFGVSVSEYGRFVSAPTSGNSPQKSFGATALFRRKNLRQSVGFIYLEIPLLRKREELASLQ
jgi:hypothetical protein